MTSVIWIPITSVVVGVILLILGFRHKRQSDEALRAFEEMLREEEREWTGMFGRWLAEREVSKCNKQD